jgi:hypothetical protein
MKSPFDTGPTRVFCRATCRHNLDTPNDQAHENLALGAHARGNGVGSAGQRRLRDANASQIFAANAQLVSDHARAIGARRQ